MKNLHVPITVNNRTSNSFYVIDEEEIYTINNNIITLFSTPSGIRIRNADFGIIAYMYLNEARTSETIGLIRQDVRDKFKKYIKNATLNSIEVKLNNDKTILLKGT